MAIKILRAVLVAGTKAPRILIFSIVLGGKYLSYVKSIATFALTFLGYVISVLASVYVQQNNTRRSINSSIKPKFELLIIF